MSVVEDTDDLLLLWLPAGTRRKVPAPHPGSSGAERDLRALPSEASHRGVVDNLEAGDWAYADHTWDVSTLWLLRPDDWHAIWVSWLPSGEPLGWYVNLQRPYCRTATGIEAMDLMLDLVVELDGSWRWKDRREFDAVVERGLLDRSTVDRVLTEADGVIERIEANAAPFNEDWHRWRPPAHWETPRLPSGWERVPARA